MRTEREKLRAGNLITPREIEMICGSDIDAAEREYDYICQQIGTANGELTVKQYCDYSELDYQEIVSFLNPYRNGRKVQKGEE